MTVDDDDDVEAASLQISKDASVLRFLRLNSASVLSAIVRTENNLHNYETQITKTDQKINRKHQL